MEGRNELHEREDRERAWLAWHSGALAQWDPKKFPKLTELTGDPPSPSAGQTPDQMLSAMRAWVARAKD